MYEVRVFVPTRGWKLVGKYRQEGKAREQAQEFSPPMHTQISDTSLGRVIFFSRKEDDAAVPPPE